MKPSIQFVKRPDGVKLAYTRFGKGQVLVFPSPWVTSLSYIIEDPFANHFWERISEAATVILYDKHGCGQSDRDRKDFSLESELVDLETVIDHLGLGQFSLLGSSMAGPVAMAFTSRHPQKVTRLILYGTFASGKNLATEDVKSALMSLIRASWGLGSKAIADIFLPGANTKELESLAKFQRESSSPETAARIMELAYSFDVTGLLSGIKIPTLILHRDGDKAIPIDHGRKLAGEIPNSVFRVMKGKIHPWWYGESDEIINEILGFLSGGTSKPPINDKTEVFSAKDQVGDIPDSRFDGSEIVEQATIVFTDIVSSTQLVTELGDATARDIFLQHDRIIRERLEKYGGKELQNLGDGFMLSFNSPSAAIRCACDIQSELSKSLPSVRVRMAINTGEVVKREGEHPFGQAVVLASRIISKAKGGQVLVSDVSKQLASGSKFSFSDKGRFKPKGFSETIKTHEVHWRENLEGSS